MNRRSWARWLDSFPDIRKSKSSPADENPKWLGLSAIAFVLVVCGAVAQAQQPKKVPRVGFLGTASPSAAAARMEALRQGLHELGYVDGNNIVIEQRYAEEKLDRLNELAAELARLKVDVIVTVGPPATRVAKKATTVIPIVMGVDDDPVVVLGAVVFFSHQKKIVALAEKSRLPAIYYTTEYVERGGFMT